MNRHRLKTTVNKLLITAVAVFVTSISQGQEWDFITWHKLSVGGELVKDFSLSIEQQVRLNENSIGLDETFTEIGVGYDLPKGFDLSGAYRLAWGQNDDRSFKTSHRYNIDLSYSKKVWKFGTKIRARFQHRPSPSLSNERLETESSPVFVRLKGSLYYRKLGDWKPGIEFETFIRVEDPNEMGAKKFRYRVFVDYDLPKRQELGLFYMLQTDHFGKTPEFVSIVGINYSYEWKRPKKKKKKKDKDKK